MIVNDGLVSFTSKMGTDRDKAATAQYVASAISPVELDAAYRTSWLARAVVDKRSDDATRKWREWTAPTPEAVSAIEREENRLQLKSKVNKALKLASLHGGSVMYFDTGQRPEEPLRANSIRKGGLRFVTVFPRASVNAQDVVKDPLDPRFGLPEYFELKQDGVNPIKVHWTRFALFPGGETLSQNSGPWGESHLLPVIDAMKQFEGTAANIASLVYEAKIDVFGVAGLTDIVGTDKGENDLKRRYGLLAVMKGINGMIVMDKDNESYDQKSASFAGLTEILDKFQQNVSGATGYPRAILFGTHAGGLGSNGELELSNYYDRIAEIQDNDIRPAIELLDECLIRSALGSRPSEVWYEWRSLWQMSDREKAEIGKIQAETIGALHATMLFDDDTLRDAAVNMFAEAGTLPGIEATARDDDETDALGNLE